MYRKRPFAIHRQGHRQMRAAVCRIPCLILCLANVERVDQCRAPNLPCVVRPDGLGDRLTGQPFTPTAPALSLEHLILQAATVLPPPPPGRAPGALRQYQDSLRGHCQIENPGSLVPVRYNLQRRAMHPCSLRCLRCSSVKYRRYSWSSRLTHEAPHSPRCDAGLSPRTARKARTGNRDIGLLRLARSQYA